MNRLKEILGITSLFLFIITAAIAITILFVPLYQITIRTQNIPQSVGLSYEQLMDNYYVLLRYLHFPWISELNLPDFPSSDSGLLHFYEVRRLFYVNYGLLLVSGIVSFIYLRILIQSKRLWVLIKPFFLASLMPPVLLMLLAIGFDQMFVIFHQVFFNNDAWLFNPATDPVINALPQVFFMYCFILFFFLVEISFILGYQFSKRKAFN